MQDIDEIDLRLIDMSLLIVFLGIMRHRQATAVAHEMGLTQPAVSHALKRLRKLYNDPLFLRRSQGLEPTPLARELEPKIHSVVQLMSETLSGRTSFDPQSTTRNIRIGAFDHELATIVPRLVEAFDKLSPDLGVQAFAISNFDALEALKTGAIDLALGYFDLPARNSPEFVVEHVLSDRYVFAARRGHSILAHAPRPSEFASAKHILVSSTGPATTLVDDVLQAEGLQRTVSTTVPSVLAALAIVEKTDLVLTLPESVAGAFAGRYSIDYAPLPMDVPHFELNAVRHRRNRNDPFHIWLNSVLKDLWSAENHSS